MRLFPKPRLFNELRLCEGDKNINKKLAVNSQALRFSGSVFVAAVIWQESRDFSGVLILNSQPRRGVCLTDMLVVFASQRGRETERLQQSIEEYVSLIQVAVPDPRLRNNWV